MAGDEGSNHFARLVAPRVLGVQTVLPAVPLPDRPSVTIPRAFDAARHGDINRVIPSKGPAPPVGSGPIGGSNCS